MTKPWRTNLTYFAIPILMVTLFASAFWILSFQNHSEPMALRVLYRYWDYGYFPLITRLVRFGNGEAFAFDSLSRGVMPWPLSGLLPYALLNVGFGLYGFILGDVFVSIARFFAFYYLFRGVGHRLERVGLALMVFFATSVYILGDYGLGDYENYVFTRGVWGLRIPRDLVTSVYLVLALGALAQMTRYLGAENKKWWKVVCAALPLALLCQGDVYAGICLALAYAIYLGFVLAHGRVEIKRTLVFLLAGSLFVAPFVSRLGSVNAELLARIGRYPIIGGLALITLPLKAHLLLLMAGAVGLVGLHRSCRTSPFNRLLLVGWLSFACAMIASPFYSALAGSGAQEYQFAYRVYQLGGLFLILAIVFAVRTVLITLNRRWEDACKFIWVTMAIPLFVINMSGMIEFSETFTRKETAPESSSDANWRAAAREVYDYVAVLSEQTPLVFATFDHQLSSLLLLQRNTYGYLMDPQFTPASDRELAVRYLKFCRILKLSDRSVLSLISDLNVHLTNLSAAKYQFNRYWTFAGLEHYPTNYVGQLIRLGNNWGRALPRAVIEDFMSVYRAIDEVTDEYRRPEVIILNKDKMFGVVDVAGYQKDLENLSFVVYASTPHPR